MTQISLKVTYQEYLIIRHSLESYADKWGDRTRELLAIRDCEDTSVDMKERCTIEIYEVHKIQLATQKLWLNVTNQMHEQTKVPNHIQESFQDPEQND